MPWDRAREIRIRLQYLENEVAVPWKLLLKFLLFPPLIYNLAFFFFFPEYEHRKGYFWEGKSRVFGGCFPSGCLHVCASNFQISIGPGREALKAKDCEH